MLRKLTPLLLIAVLFVSLITTACPSQSTIQKAIHAAQKIDSVTATAVQTTILAFNENLITAEQKESLLPKLNLLAKGSDAFKNAAEKLKAEYSSGIPPDKFIVLSAMLEANVVAPFLEVLSELKLIKNSSKILAAIGLIHVTLISILQAFEKKETVSQINYRYRELEIGLGKTSA